MMFTPTELGNRLVGDGCRTITTTSGQIRRTNTNRQSPRTKMVVVENRPNKTSLLADFTHQQGERTSTCCPLRLNESSVTTIGVSLNCNNTRSMKLNRLVGGNNNVTTATCGRQQSLKLLDRELFQTEYNNINNNNKLVKSHELVTAGRMKSVRNYHSQHRYSWNNHLHSHRLIIQLAAIIVLVTSLVSPLDCLADTQVVAPTTPSLCPLVSSCLCKWSNGKISTSCERRNLQTIPMQLPGDTQILDLTGNNLNQLPQHIFQDRRITNLQKLFLSECKISHISDEAFAQLTNLIELDLSNNNIQQVPTKALELLKYSLRKLNLAHNLIHVLDTAAFGRLSHLNLLDLSNNQLTQMRPNPFHGLTELKELKLNENRLSQLSTSVISDLNEFLIIDLYGNPWNCDCELRQSIELMYRRRIQQSINPTCASPQRHKDIRWQNVKPEEFMCPPVIINKQNELIVGAGSNVTLECTARGSAPLTFVWFQDEKNLTRSGTSNQSEPPPSTKLLEEKRYEIAEEQTPHNTTTSILYLMNLKLTDTSLFLCWVENPAGYTLGNFSLIVNDSPPANLAGGSSSSSSNPISGLGNSILHLFGFDSNDSTGAQITVVLVGILLLLIIAVICLWAFKLIIGGHSSKSSSNSDLKPHQMNGKLSSSNKFSTNAARPGNKSSAGMFASSDDVATSEDDADYDQASSGSQSSCRKNNPKIMAVNDLDGFIEHMRSGIINMDYHNLSPVIQFNNTMKRSNNQQQQQQQQHQIQEAQQLPLLNHFPTASNASSQQPLYSIGQTSNGSNSMATTLSDLSSPSGSASTSFANSNNNNNNNGNNVMYAQQHLMGTISEDMSTLSRRPPPTANCDFQGHPEQMRNCQLQNQLQLQQQQQHQQQHLHHQEMSSAPSYTSDCQSGYSEDPLLGAGHHHPTQMIPPAYKYDMNMFPQHHLQQQHQQQLYNPMTLVGGTMPMQQQHHEQVLRNSSRPSSMNGQVSNEPAQLMNGRTMAGNIQQDSPGGFHIL